MGSETAQAQSVPDRGPDAPHPLVWPTLLEYPRPDERVVYLDLNHYIALAKARSGHSDGARHRAALDAFERAAASGAVFVLSSTHYAEIAKIKDPRQRRGLVDVIEPLTGFRTLLSLSVVMRLEMEAALDNLLGPASPAYDRVPLLGRGVGHAFGMNGWQVGEVVDGQRVPIREPLPPAAAALLAKAERELLAGPSDADVPALEAVGWNPRAGAEGAERRAAQEREFAQILDDDVENLRLRKGRLRDAVSARELIIELNDILAEARIRRGAERSDIFSSSREVIRAFTRGMPSREVAIELKTAMHRNAERAHRWTSNDVFDMDALALAVPYCNVVATEKHAATVLTSAKLDRRMNTVICRDLESVATWLDAGT